MVFVFFVSRFYFVFVFYCVFFLVFSLFLHPLLPSVYGLLTSYFLMFLHIYHICLRLHGNVSMASDSQ